MEGVLMIKIVSLKLVSIINGGSIGDEERVCQTLQLHQWRVYWWSRSRLSNSSISSMEGVLVIKTCLPNFTASSTEAVMVMKNLSVHLFRFFSGGSIGDQERVCQTLQLHQWREYWWWRTCLSNSSASLMEGVLVIKNVSVKLFSFFNGRSIGDQNVSAKFYRFFNGGSIGDEGLVCQTLQFLQWRQYWWSRTCLSNSSASSMEGVLVIKNVSVKLFRFFIGGSVGEQERVCQTLQLHKWRVYWWSRSWLSKFQLHYWREYWWSIKCLSKPRASLL